MNSRVLISASLVPFVAAIAHKARILDVVYNASNNELVRTKTLVKSCIVQVRPLSLSPLHTPWIIMNTMERLHRSA